MLRRPLAILITAASVLSASRAGAQTFDFDAVPFGNVPFSVTSGGVTASFSSPSSGFEILDASVFAPGTVAGLSGRYLGDANADIVVEPLTVQFSLALESFLLNFALFDQLGATDFTVQAYLGPTLVAGATFFGVTGPGSSVPEGIAGIAGRPFDRLVFSSTSSDFGIDALAVAAVPEPATVGLVAAGLAALGAAARRRRR